MEFHWPLDCGRRQRIGRIGGAELMRKLLAQFVAGQLGTRQGIKAALPRFPGRTRVAFSFVGGSHQFWHSAPVAAVLSRMTSAQVACFVTSSEDQAVLTDILTALGAGPVDVVTMALPVIVSRLLSVLGWEKDRPLKIVRLFWWARVMARYDVIVAVERTSVLLKWLTWRTPQLVHIPHGAGDRERGYDRRIRHFDYVFVAGEKDRDRFVQFGIVRSEQVVETGYVKRAGLLAVQPKRLRFFENNRPVVIYNPHFSKSLSSWHAFGHQIIEMIAADGRFNLIFAPHVRLFEHVSPVDKKRIKRLAKRDSVIIDLGSPRSIDMSYTTSADIYLGDVSSQVYEFCAVPRPCVFINAKGVDWRQNPFYAMWAMGNVIQNPHELLPALCAALATPAAHNQVQQEAVQWSFGDPAADASQVAASRLMVIARIRTR